MTSFEAFSTISKPQTCEILHTKQHLKPIVFNSQTTSFKQRVHITNHKSQTHDKLLVNQSEIKLEEEEKQAPRRGEWIKQLAIVEGEANKHQEEEGEAGRSKHQEHLAMYSIKNQ